ncbi:hypothetical protein OXX79_002166 [Metschnikowia pulcherrima]
MSYTTTATRSTAPTNINLNAFSHPPVQRETLENYTKDSHLMPVMSLDVPDSPSPQLSDNEDLFNLDMVTMDMNFEQAYSMYTQLQQKNAQSEVEQLHKAQQLNLKSTHRGNDHKYQADIFSSGEIFPQQMQSQHIPEKDWGSTPRQYAGDQLSSSQDQGLPPSHHHPTSQFQNKFEQSQSQASSQYVGRHLSVPTMASGPLITPPGEMIQGLDNLFTGQQAQLSKSEKTLLDAEEGEDEDQFFSTTEASALDRFLDNLAFSSEVNPLEFYNQNQPKIPHMFELQTMGQSDDLFTANSVKKDLVDALDHHSTHDLKTFGVEPFVNTQLRTPDNSLNHSASKRDREDSVSSESSAKKKRKAAKPLLSLTQKRLNHSNSEQKRRLLCKEAYDRCLRLVTNVDDYKHDLVSASANSSARKKSKRKQLNKDGLPNLSKHSALLKISNEIIKIQQKNEGLRKLLNEF